MNWYKQHKTAGGYVDEAFWYALALVLQTDNSVESALQKAIQKYQLEQDEILWLKEKVTDAAPNINVSDLPAAFRAVRKNPTIAQTKIVPDCSNPKDYPWGFQNFEIGTPGYAILDYFSNQSYSEGDPYDSYSIADELNIWINNMTIANDIASSWEENPSRFLEMSIFEQENAIKQWLRQIILKYKP